MLASRGVQQAVEYLPSCLGDETELLPVSQGMDRKEIYRTVSGSQHSGRQSAGCSTGPKACAQCGTTRTPQWREGPEGPKTLCNACGVKRVRQMRTGSDTGRRKSTKPVAIAQQDFADVLVTADYNGPKDTLQRRPSRKVATKVVVRAMEEAAQPYWEEDEDQSCRSSQDTGSAESGGHNSDSAEEVAWVPERNANPGHLPPSPMAKAVGPECAAAVNLLCMSVHENAAKQAAQLQPRSSSGNTLKDVPKINAASYAQMANSALKWSSHIPSHLKAQDLIQDALGFLPEEKHTEILTVKAELDFVSREAAAADAAVAAVAKILAMKQAAAIKARASAAKAAKRIHTFMQSLDNEYGWSQQVFKRQRSFQ